MVAKVIIARASRWATSPATPPLVGRRVKNVLEKGKLCNCCISGATTETEVFRESCFCSDRAVFDTIGAIIHTALLQLVTTVRSVLVELTACPPKYRRNLHVNYVPPNLPVALIS